MTPIRATSRGEARSSTRPDMKDTQTAKPQVFRTGDGWFSDNRATNLSQM